MTEPTDRPERGSPWRIVQLTDSHLFADPERRLQGMNTRESFNAVVDLVKQEQTDIDLILGTGDITQDNSEAAYRYFHDHALSLAPAMAWCPGNHDEAETFYQLEFARDNIPRFIDNDHWRIVLLNSSVSDAVHGYLESDELEALDVALATAGNRHVLVALHHNPIPSGSAWLDNHILKNAQDLYQVLAPYNSVRGLLWGHIHQHVEKVIDGVLHLSTPSTCIQFAPRQHDFKLDDLPPGYRWLQLYPDGHIETDISRVDVMLDVDLEGSGY